MVTLTVRLPDDLHAKIVKLAEKERRSLNAEVIVRLEASVKKA
jgi:predicted HicB family RNase H-like nuclease